MALCLLRTLSRLMLEIAVQLTASHQLPLGKRELVAALADSNLITVPCFQPHWRTLMPFVLHAVNGSRDNTCADASAGADYGLYDNVDNDVAAASSNGIRDMGAGGGGNYGGRDGGSGGEMAGICAGRGGDATVSLSRLKASLQQRVWLPHLIRSMRRELLHLRESTS